MSSNYLVKGFENYSSLPPLLAGVCLGRLSDVCPSISTLHCAPQDFCARRLTCDSPFLSGFLLSSSKVSIHWRSVGRKKVRSCIYSLFFVPGGLLVAVDKGHSSCQLACVTQFSLSPGVISNCSLPLFLPA